MSYAQALQGEEEAYGKRHSQEGGSNLGSNLSSGSSGGGMSRAGSGSLPEASGGSFMQLLRNVSLQQPSYVDSAELVDGADGAKSGMRVRMKNYFNRQKVDT